MQHVDLDKAVRAGVIRSDQADALRRLDEQIRHAPAATEERFALVSGFADVMAAVGIAMVSITLVALLGTRAPVLGFGFPFLAWYAATYFCAKRRLMLCSFILFAVFAIGCAGAALALAMVAAGLAPSTPPHDIPVFVYVLTSGIATLASYLWWRRFELPFAFASFAAALVNVFVNSVRAAFPHLPSLGVDLVGFACGPILFIWAMWWDMSDVRRETVRSDVAFWLHMAAGFLIVKGTMTLVLGTAGGAESWGRMFKQISNPSPEQSVTVLLLFLVFATIALVIDRRSLLTSGMFYAVPAAVSLFGGLGTSSLSAAFLVCGLTLTFLAVRWAAMRERMLDLLPRSISAQLPRPQLKAVGPRPVY